MSSAIGAAVPALASARRHVPARRIAETALSILVFLGGFVVFEPAPYELALVGLAVGWIIAGLRINRYILPLLILLLLYVVGGMIGLAFIEDFIDPILYLSTTALLATSAILFAAVIVADPERRLRVIINAYTAVGVTTAIIGILGYFELLPASKFFTLYGRARGTFQDPNVFGPFMILPFSYLSYTIFTRRLGDSRWQMVGALIMLTALILTFSRAAWGMTAIVLLIVSAIAFINQRNGGARARVMIYLAIGVGVGVALIAVLLSLPGHLRTLRREGTAGSEL